MGSLCTAEKPSNVLSVLLTGGVEPIWMISTVKNYLYKLGMYGLSKISIVLVIFDQAFYDFKQKNLQWIW